MKQAFIILAWLVLLWGQPLAAQTKEVTNVLCLGQAPATGSEAQARERAVNDALRRAVGRVAVEMVDTATLAEKLDLLKLEILDKAPSFVEAYSLRSAKVDQGVALALVSVGVNRGVLDQALTRVGLRLGSARLAKTLVLVSEDTAPGRPPVFWWSGIPGVPSAPAPVAAVLKSLGVEITDINILKGKVPEEERQAVLNEEQALELARLAGAGLVLMGRVRTYPLVTSPGAEVSPLAQLQVLDAVQGKVLAMEEVEGPGFSTTPGSGASQMVNQAVEQAVRKLLEQVAGASTTSSSGQKEVLVTIKGVRSLADLNHFEEVLGSLTSQVAELSRESAGAGWARLRLKLKVSSSQLADQLLLEDFGGFLINVTEMGPQSMKLVMIPK
ncbi:MAG: hypothetical protein PVG03_01570 [Desulfarculaceae bacterium]|jgi:hypothetical protein